MAQSTTGAGHDFMSAAIANGQPRSTERTAPVMRCHMSALNCAFRITGLTSSILGGRRPISRVLSWTVIHLGPESLQGSSNQPAPTAGSSIGGLFGLAPGGVYLAANCYQTRGALLPHPFTLTGQPKLT